MIKQLAIILLTVCLVSFETQDRPTIYLIGDSTVRNSNQEYWGWGSLLGEFLDTAQITVANHAMAGRSTRTFRKEGRWDRVKENMKPGDVLLIQFGHNEGSKPDTTRQGYRGVLRGIGQDSITLDWGYGETEIVRTYGENLRRFVRETKEIGAYPILLSMIPRNQWDEQGRTKRANQDFGLWARQIAEEEHVPFLDLNEITAKKYDEIGPKQVKAKYFPGDHTHTNYDGAMENAASVITGLKNIQHPLVKYIK
ncbi:rhamnogalacturonan acetylesterase [Sphingobacterium gobiense]|uniref:GDSL family lipase n=1 Tax=Sphingobacterium gobiense TaxID=1382456 RepID=A0A2S9JMI7_9SPHI|nr:rhamnogalacturonan acetylesterase [Sphingobacterium gobiense]PRD54209.1 GDSL family lipase [Sphingobacterium gobiense]